MKRLDRLVGRNRKSSIAHNMVRNLQLKKLVAVKLGKVLKNELISPCSVASDSLYGSRDLEKFSWTDLAADSKWTAPTLYTLLEHCVAANRSRVCSLKSDIVISLIGGILLCNTNKRINSVQRLISILLTAAHAPKQVF